jgi:TPR repeat protein
MVTPPTANEAPSAASVPAASVSTVPVQSREPTRSLGPDEIAILLKQGEDFVSVGDFASAQLVFRRVWEANDARGAIAFGGTYDPIVLARIGAKGATPDVAKAREWYGKAKDLGSADAGSRLEALASQNFRTRAQKRAAMDSTGMKVSNEEPSQNPPANQGPAPAGTYWKHSNSIMRLEATGLGRKFFFYKPSDAELQAGAKAESLRFDGHISGNGYTGTAFLYSDKCGRSAFQVLGQIENNESRVILSGKSPQVDGDCREIGRSDQKLVFDLLNTPPK